MLIQHNGELLDSEILYKQASPEHKALYDYKDGEIRTLRFKLQQSLREIERLTMEGKQ